MKRRTFIALFGGAAAVLPLAARAQHDRMRRIGALFPLATDDPEQMARRVALRLGLERIGWTDGRNARIDYRHAAGGVDQFEPLAKELVALKPDVIFAQIDGGRRRRASARPAPFPSSSPIVSDPIGAGFVTSLARPGGNITGFVLFEASVIGKWLSMLKEMTPGLKRAAIMANPKTAALRLLPAFGRGRRAQARLEIVPSRVESAEPTSNAPSSPSRASRAAAWSSRRIETMLRNRDLIIALAARHRLPAVYPERIYVADGGLDQSYGIADIVEPFRQAAVYIDRILQRREAGRSAGAGADQVFAGRQPQDGEGARPHRAFRLLVAADEVIE